MHQTQMSDLWILSSFRERVAAIPGIHQRTIPAAQALLAEAQQTIAELEGNGHSHADALDLCNKIVNMVHEMHDTAMRRRNEREDRAERLREIHAEAYYNQ